MSAFGKLVSYKDWYSGKFHCEINGLDFEKEKERLGIDQQKRALDQLVDKQYNKIHEDAFAKIVRQRKASKPASERARGIIWALWKERTRFKLIMKTQDFEYAKLLKENEGLRAELAALKKTKGDYGQA
ncbi:hypothetical protein [Leptospira johnsonii]|uniref:Uncharacterized protein n=1 Tax=Leptospira johnsonii TaxID=1917820 RepID=A0A2P2D7P0_9LEPT|nr:hypothetical protein [Leptospira johnsonii]GBF40644.1 hypothetical protein LPTSP1_36620 [Leptospira johnsonii]